VKFERLFICVLKGIEGFEATIRTKKYADINTSMPRAGFEPAVAVFSRVKTGPLNNEGSISEM
jgi:hypothetical protein